MPLQFKATNEQVMKLAANAVNASHPVGMGFFQFNPSKTFNPDDFREWVEVHQELNLDYVGGRMTKLRARFLGDELWEVPNPSVNIEYQSWGDTYSTYEQLLESAGIKEYRDI